MLWAGLLLLTIGAIAAIVVPLLRPRRAPAPPRAAFDRAVYRDQLGEIARDLARGTLAARRDGAPAEHAPGDLAASVDALAARLKEAPGDPRGWLLLARSQASLQRWQDSAASYQRAMALTDSPEASAGFGEMLVMAADGLVTPAARSAFAAALARDPDNAPARFYLALGAAQDGKASEAIAADIKALQAMSPAERQAMIRGMVERLAARLEANPDDEEGWQRLARAYAVLGETEKAAAASARAAAAAKRQP